ncbi:MAG: ribosome assembly cofactor RimP [Bacteroidales bacterium]|nr:ribosome assembly cofactor RimP [Bacteroidales bacterium]
MISPQRITDLFNQTAELSRYFIVEATVSENNEIFVSVDTKEGITIDECGEVSHILEEKLDREKEDFSLEVSSPGLDCPFKVLQQYQKNIGKSIDITPKEGKKISGKLVAVNDNGIEVEIVRIEKQNKKSVKISEKKSLEFDKIKIAKLKITFK